MQAMGLGTDSTGAAQAYGTLLTRLNDSLIRVRDSLSPHAALTPGGSLNELDTLLAEFARRRVRIALYGEVKAGKSTLLNAIAGTPLSPAAFDPLTSIPVRVTYGSVTAWRIGDRRLHSVEELERVMRDGHLASAEGALAPEVVVETDLDLLQLGGQVDLIDTPGVGSDAAFDAVTANTLRSLDAVVLVVRYPALFTQFTRQLVDALEADIGKLFVVWNLDAACADLAAEERARHADTLRANVAGAHELFLLDARQGLYAAQSNDSSGRTSSGVAAFTDALRRFAGSGARELAALRETAKRALGWVTGALQALQERHAVLDQRLAEVQQRMDTVRAEAEREADAARNRFRELEDSTGRIRQETVTAVTKVADGARRELNVARRRWIRSGDFEALASTIQTIVQRYAESVEGRSRMGHDAIQASANEFGANASTTLRPRIEPPIPELSPAERRPQAVTGRWQRLRRSLWRNWYLPGMRELEASALGNDLRAHEDWLDDVVRTTVAAGREVLEQRLAEIAQRAEAAIDSIKEETSFAELSTEAQELRTHLPVVSAESQTIAGLITEARPFLERP
jgi:uncharacterized protein YicC (UPF0701 family)